MAFACWISSFPPTTKSAEALARVDFYHLTRAPAETVLPRLLERIVADGGRALLVSTDEALLNRLDDHLWRYDATAFLPHGLAGSDGDADQPVLLSARADAANGARFLLIADGQWPEGADGFERVFFLFDEGAIGAARAQWRMIEGEKHYWKQDESGRWAEGP